MTKKIFISLAILFFIGAAGLFYVYTIINEPAQKTSKEFLFEVSRGKTLTHVARELKNKGAIKSARLFLLFAKVQGKSSSLKTGEYLINVNMRPSEILQILGSGKSYGRPFTVPEGHNVFEIAQQYETLGFGKKEDFLKWVFDTQFVNQVTKEGLTSLEGYLFPETYSITKYMSAKDLITKMVERFLEVYKEVEPNIEIQNFSRHQIVTLASIIEKETGAPEERKLISSVFHNRLVKNMRLQTDPTVIYGVWEMTKKPLTNITKKDLLTPTRYNTYTNYGLPYGPISNPGKEALLAAVSPESSNYLFFVSQNDGTHIFTENYNDHLKAVREYQLNRKAREGKSWRDLKTSTK